MTEVARLSPFIHKVVCDIHGNLAIFWRLLQPELQMDPFDPFPNRHLFTALIHYSSQAFLTPALIHSDCRGTVAVTFVPCLCCSSS